MQLRIPFRMSFVLLSGALVLSGCDLVESEPLDELDAHDELIEPEDAHRMQVVRQAHESTALQDSRCSPGIAEDDVAVPARCEDLTATTTLRKIPRDCNAGEEPADCGVRLCEELKDSVVDITDACEAAPDCTSGVINPKPGKCKKVREWRSEELPWPEHTTNGCGVGENGNLYFGRFCEKKCKAMPSTQTAGDCRRDGIRCEAIP